MKIKSATEILFTRCTNPICKNIHVDLFDKHGEPFACAVVHMQDVPFLIENLQSYLQDAEGEETRQ